MVSRTETGIGRYRALYIMWPRHVLEAESEAESDLYLSMPCRREDPTNMYVHVALL